MSSATNPTDTLAEGQDPTVAAATPAGWSGWLAELLHAGKRRLVTLGLTLVLGYGAAVFALYVLSVVAGDVREQETVQLDNAVLAWLRQFASPQLDAAARVVSLFGSEIVAGLLVVLLVLLSSQRRWGAAISLLLVVGGAQLLNDVLKALFHRTRPAPVLGLIPAQDFSFPSGHAMVSASFYFFLAYLAWRVLRGWRRTTVAAGLVLLVLLIGVARLYLEAHYFTDVVAGYLAGFLWTDAVLLAGHVLSRRGPVADPSGA